MSVEFEITNRSITPPGGWKYTQPESGAVFKSHDYRTWTSDILSHRKANGYAFGEEWEAELLDQACKENPNYGQSVCKRIMDTKIRPKKRPGFKEAIGFLRVLQSFVKSGGVYVDESIAAERAEICARCPHNQPQDFSCGSCASAIMSLLGWLMGKRTLPADYTLNSCNLCGCNLRAAIWFPVSAQKDGLSEEQKIAFEGVRGFCWKAKEL